MPTTNEKIGLLRTAMKAAGANACLIPSSDPHISEYLPAHWAARRYFSGFTGSVGNLVVTETSSALWVDGRYFVQAAHQLEGSEIVLQRMGVEGVPTLMEYLADALGEGQVLAVDGMVTATSTMKELEKVLAKKGASVKSVDLVEGNWPDRPAVPASEAWLLDTAYAGRTAAEKLADLRAELEKQGAQAMVVCRLDSVAWLLNLRASDLDNTPFALARRTSLTLVDEAGTNWAVYSALKENPAFTLKAGADPIQALKGVKNPVEIENLKKVHVKDGVAMVKFQMWLEEKMAAGETVTEVDVDEKLMALRDNVSGNFRCLISASPDGMRFPLEISRELYVEGKIRTRSYDDQSGIKRYVTEIFVDNMEMLTPKSIAPAAQPVAQQPVQTQAAPAQDMNTANDENLPF